MTARLPTPGVDRTGWGTTLNEFLGVAHNSDGTLKNAAFVSVKDSTYGAKGDTVLKTSSGAITSGTTAFTASNAAFTSADIGKLIYVAGAGASGAVLSTTIAAYVSSTAVTLATTAATTVSNARYYYGSDDTAALQSAFATGRLVYAPAGFYLTDPVALPARFKLEGAGIGVTEFVAKPGLSTGFFSLADDDAELVQLSHLTLNGQRAFQTSSSGHGLVLNGDPLSANVQPESYYGSNDPAHYIGHIMIRDFKGDGMQTGGRGACKYEHIRSYNNDGHGFYIDNFDSFWSNIEAGGLGLNGFHMAGNASNNRINNLKVFYSGQIDRTTYGQGLHVEGDRNQFGVVELQQCGTYGAYLDGATFNIFGELFVEFPPQVVGALPIPSNPGIYLNDSTDNVIFTNILDRPSATKLTYGIELHKTGSGCLRNTIIANIKNALTGTHTLTGGQTITTNVLLINGDTSFDTFLTDVQIFTANGTWTKPPRVTTVQIVAAGAGGGGGSGRRGAAASVRTGGGGGGGGGKSVRTVPASVLSATEAVVVGVAGTGGAAQTADNTDGTAGTAGTSSTFKSNFCFGGLGAAGSAGSTAQANGGSGGGATFIAAGGAASSGTGAAGSTGGVPAEAGAGGGSGGGITSGDATSNGGAGGAVSAHNGGGGTAGTTPGGGGGNGTSRDTNSGNGGGGGGGGASSISGAAGAGGNGGLYGGGGGGGGASLNGNNSGKGGDGAAGIVIVTSW